jgi:hypothetical protein
MNIINKTRKPMSVPLPAGKRLFLGPGRTGQVAPGDLEHPPLAALVQAGEIEISGGGPKPNDGEGGSRKPFPGAQRGGARPGRQSGDR